MLLICDMCMSEYKADAKSTSNEKRCKQLHSTYRIFLLLALDQHFSPFVAQTGFSDTDFNLKAKLR